MVELSSIPEAIQDLSESMNDTLDELIEASIDAFNEIEVEEPFEEHDIEFDTNLPISGVQQEVSSNLTETPPTPPSEPSPSFDGASMIMSNVLSKSLSSNPLLHYFNRMLMGYELSGFKEFCPDINGYVFIFMLPPHLSGYKLDVHIDSPLGRVSKMFPFFGIDFTPPPTSIITSTIPSRSGGINYGSEIEATGQLQITYIDNDSLQCFGYHKTWVNYIEDISRGLISPDSKYLDPVGANFGEIDYATSAYIARFKPTSSIGWGDLVYIGKAVGIFPISLPDKEVIGRRDSNEITMLPFTYACTFYRQCTFGSPIEVHDWIIDELSDQCLSAYKM